MRNLKRVLALALALIMTLGLMITASAASYADADQIDANYGEAIEVLTNMRVFRGQANGGESTEFAPKDILTRAEAATLVYRLLTADVTDAKKSNYDYTSFDDVKEGEWWTGYITYAANGKYVVGYGNGKFGPNDQVTGIEVLTIMLRALGYGQNGEFVGGGWKDHVLTTANENGMLKGVATDDLDKGASRELVAQLLFNAITEPKMVNYAPLTGYSKTAQTLGEKNFSLVEIEGVVTANEYADLYDTEPQAKGKTVIGNKTYNVTTAMTDIGESRRGWAIGKDVLFLTDSGTNTIYETGAAVKKLDAKTIGMKLDDAEKFLNFSGSDTYTSDYRIEYVLSVDTTKTDIAKFIDEYDLKGITKDDFKASGKNDGIYTYDKVFKVGATINADHYANIETIFSIADREDGIVVGEVYVGTKSTKDISDDISFKTFKAEYLDDDATDANVTTNENGNWLKIVDVDSDGVADYIMKTEFIMTTIDDISKKDVYTFSGVDGEKDVTVDGKDIFTEDELAEDDVILYALIDGVYYVNVVTPVTESIDKKGIDYRNETITCDGETYEWSGIEKYTPAGFDSDISYAETETSYDLYLDHFGYVRLYTESAINKGFVLLLDGYFETDRRTSGYKAEIWNAADEKSEDVVVLDTKAVAADTFIEDDYDDNTATSGRDEGTWGRLKEFEQTYLAPSGKKFTTNIAAYSVNADGEYVLDYVQNASNRKEYTTAEVETLSKGKVIDVTTRELVNSNGRMPVIQTTTDTLYYMVINKGKTTEILSWTGYKNAPKNAVLDAATSRAYAVLTEGEGNYDVAEIVVFETGEAASKTLNFIYGQYQKWDPTSNRHQSVYALGYNAETEEYAIEQQLNVAQNQLATGELILFADIFSNGNVSKIIDNYADSNIYAGTVRTGGDIDKRDYVTIDVVGGGSKSFYTTTVPAFVVIGDTKTDNVSRMYGMDEQKYDFEIGQRVIFVTDSKGSIQYIINVDLSYNKQDTSDKGLGKVAALNDLYDDIKDDALELHGYDAAIADAKAALAANPQVQGDLEKALTDLNTALKDKTLTVQKVEDGEKLVDDLEKAIAAIKGANALTTYVTDAKKALDEAVKGYEDDKDVKAAYDAEIKQLDALEAVPEKEYAVPEDVTKAVEAAKAAEAAVTTKYEAYVWALGTKGNVQIAFMRLDGEKAGTWLSLEEVMKLGFKPSDFTMTLNGKTYDSAEKIVSYLNTGSGSETLENNKAGFIKINFGSDAFTAGQVYGTAEGTVNNCTFALTVDQSVINVTSYLVDVKIPTA